MTEALNSPNDDAMAKWKAADAADIARMAESLRQYPAEELAKHGITLAPEKDWATELWADCLKAYGLWVEANSVRQEPMWPKAQAVIELLRTRFEQLIAERSKRDA